MASVPRCRRCREEEKSSLPSSRESPERRALVLNFPICFIPHPVHSPASTPTLGHPLPRLFVFWEKSPNQDVKSQPPPSYPPWLYFKLLRPPRKRRK